MSIIESLFNNDRTMVKKNIDNYCFSSFHIWKYIFNYWSLLFITFSENNEKKLMYSTRKYTLRERVGNIDDTNLDINIISLFLVF